MCTKTTNTTELLYVIIIIQKTSIIILLIRVENDNHLCFIQYTKNEVYMKLKIFKWKLSSMFPQNCWNNPTIAHLYTSFRSQKKMKHYHIRQSNKISSILLKRNILQQQKILCSRIFHLEINKINLLSHNKSFGSLLFLNML